MIEYSYKSLSSLQRTHSALKLLRSDNFAMVIAFFYQIFIKHSKRAVAAEVFEERFSDFLYSLEICTNTPKEYINYFIKQGFLRKFYNDEELLYELTPSVYKVFEFLASLEKKDFVGSETKLTLILTLLEKMEYEASSDEEVKITILQNQIEELQRKIKYLKLQKEIREDRRKLKELYQEIMELARKTLYDFSQIEENFKELNRKTKEKISSSSIKTEVLDFAFDAYKAIKKSEQGESFEAFWKLLRSPKSSQLQERIDKLYQNEIVAEFDKEMRLKNFQHELMQRAYKIQLLTDHLVQQLGNFIDERGWIENKRVVKLIDAIYKKILQNQEPPKITMQMELSSIEFSMPFEKDLYTIKKSESFTPVEHTYEEISFDTSMLFLKNFVDEKRLYKNIQKFFHIQNSFTLKELLEHFPPSQGIAEVIGYIALGVEKQEGVVHEERYEEVVLESEAKKIKLKIPQIVYVRK